MANDQYNIINSNALEFLHKEQSDKYNLIYIDPPYFSQRKPIELLQRLITAYTDKGDIVLDYFCGSGTTGEAALSMDRRCVLVDQNPNAIQITADRLSKTNV